jgi:hypothetical protein
MAASGRIISRDPNGEADRMFKSAPCRIGFCPAAEAADENALIF